MAKTTKVNVDIGEINKIITNLENSSDSVGNAKVLTNNKIPKYSKLKVDDQVNAALDCLLSCLEFESKEIGICKDKVKELKQTIKKWDSKVDVKKQIKKSLTTKNEKKLKKSYESLVSLIGVKKAKAYVKGLTLGTSVKFSKDAKSIIGFKKTKVTTNSIKATKVSPQKDKNSNNQVISTSSDKITQTNAVTTKKTNSKATTVASLKKNLKKALKNNKEQKAKKYYQLLVTAIGAKKTNKYLNKLGYDKNLQKKYFEEKISTVVDEKNNNNNNNNSNNNNGNINNDNTIKNDEHINNIIDKIEDSEKPIFPDKNEPDSPNEDINNSQDNNQNNTNNDNTDDVVATETVSPNQPDSNNSSSKEDIVYNDDSYGNDYNDEFDDYDLEDDFRTEQTEQIEPGIIDSIEGDNDFTDIEDEDEPANNKVITIDDNNDNIEINNNKKSSNLSTVVPLGLGAIATGAAAVAGVRYVKNKHNNSIEYSEDYEDSDEINSNTESQYIDSAQYDNDYQDDIYDGPIGSSYMDASDFEDSLDLEQKIESNSYIDPSSIENEDDIEDLALDELNSGLYNG